MSKNLQGFGRDVFNKSLIIKIPYLETRILHLTINNHIMNFSTIIGSLGVSLLLIAFFMNLFRFILPESKMYILLNIIGAGLSCYASVLIHYNPFIILEGTWCIVAVAALFRKTGTSIKP